MNTTNTTRKFVQIGTYYCAPQYAPIDTALDLALVISYTRDTNPGKVVILPVLEGHFAGKLRPTSETFTVTPE